MVLLAHEYSGTIRVLSSGYWSDYHTLNHSIVVFGTNKTISALFSELPDLE